VAGSAGSLVGWGWGTFQQFETSPPASALAGDLLLLVIAADSFVAGTVSNPIITASGGITFERIDFLLCSYALDLVNTTLQVWRAQPEEDWSGDVTIDWGVSIHAMGAYLTYVRGSSGEVPQGNNGALAIGPVAEGDDPSGDGLTVETFQGNAVWGVAGSQADHGAGAGWTDINGPTNPDAIWRDDVPDPTLKWTGSGPCELCIGFCIGRRDTPWLRQRQRNDATQVIRQNAKNIPTSVQKGKRMGFKNSYL